MPPSKKLFIGYCHICGKKLKGRSRQGLKKSRSEHYRKSHEIDVNELKDNEIFIFTTLYKTLETV